MTPRARRKRYGSARRDNLLGQPVERGVFVPAALLILALAAFGTLAPQRLEAGATAIQEAIADQLGWLYLLAMNVFLVLALVLAFGRFGRIRIGGEDAEREFSSWGWYSMLFAAGTGVGLLFYGVAEPISYFTAPPVGEAGSVEAARQALVQSFFHWGLHGWSMYALVGLAMAFARFNRGLPLTVRSAFEPLVGSRVHGRLGKGIDVLAVTGTLFGVAVSLGLGAKQVNTGLAESFGVPIGVEVQLALIAGITVAATISVVTGLSAGIQRLSKLALATGAMVALYVIVVGPTAFLFHALVESAGAYVQDLVRRGTWLEAFAPPGSGDWQNQWTLFYFAWWISWSPFVGMFIGRISRGRTLREYLLGVLLMPTGVSMLRLTVMGGSALHRELFGAGGIAQAVERDAAAGGFALLQSFAVPEAIIVASMAALIATVAIFFVTSSDSGSLVIDILSSGGDPDPAKATRVFWATLEGVVAGILLVAGGLTGMQAAATITGLPFVLVILGMCAGLYAGLRRYAEAKEEGTGAPTAQGD